MLTRVLLTSHVLTVKLKSSTKFSISHQTNKTLKNPTFDYSIYKDKPQIQTTTAAAAASTTTTEENQTPEGKKMSGIFMRKSSVLRLVRSHLITDSATTATPISSGVRQQTTGPRAYCRFPHFFRRTTTRECSNELSSSSILNSSFSSSSSKLGSGKVGLVGWYLELLKSRPVLTKSVTCSFIYMAADLSSQTIALPASEPYDLLRTLRMGGYGMLVLGPSLHFWFNFMSELFPKRDLMTTFKKMFMGQAVYGPVMTVVFFSLNACLQGESANEIIARLKRDLLPTMVNGAMYWPICDFITFKFFPVQLQPLVSNSFSYLWTIYMTYMASQARVDATS